MNRAVARAGAGGMQARVLLVHASPDAAGQYVAIMNSVFSAQKLVRRFSLSTRPSRAASHGGGHAQSVPMDACVVAETDSLFLQQVRDWRCAVA